MLARSPIAIDILEQVGGHNSPLDSDIWHSPIRLPILPFGTQYIYISYAHNVDFLDKNIYVLFLPKYSEE